MVFAILAAWKMGRPLHALGCWSIAFIVMLLWNPAVLLDPGAQLSFGVVLGLILLSRPIQRLLVRPVSPDPFLPAKLLTRGQRREEVFWIWATSLLSATIAATLVSEPITAVDFHQVTPVSVFANMVVVPAAGLITVVGTLAVAFSPIFPLWTALLNNANWLFARALIAFVGFLAHEPGASLNVADLRALATPPPSLLVFPAQDSACLLVRTGRETWLFNTGREGPARSATCRVLQFYGINRLDGLVLAQLSAADNAGADVLIRDYHPRRVVIPVLRTRSPLEKAMPAALALADHPAEAWQRGQCLALSGGLTVEVLEPSGDSRTSHAEDRALILLFRASDQTLLWAGKIGPELQWQLVADYPGLRADLLVLSPDSAPSPEWLRALQIRDWLQIPPRDKRVNITTRALEPIPTWIAWPLDETGAVSVQFRPAERKIVFRPWVALPGGT
jgi:ComEC/Rec2-related protein